jgi:hypothetical protein
MLKCESELRADSADPYPGRDSGAWVTPSSMAGFEWAAFLKGFAIVVTAAAGLYGTLFELRTADGRVTRHGRITAVIILAGLIVALLIHVSDMTDASKAAKTLEIQIAREKETLRNVENANASLSSTLQNLAAVRQRQIETTQAMNRSIEEQRQSVAHIDRSVAAATERTQKTLTTIDTDVARAQEIIRRGVARLSRPLTHIAFKYRLVFEDADKTFPAYYARVASLVGLPEDQMPEGVRSWREGDLIIYEGSEFFPTRADGDGAFVNLASDVSTVDFEERGEEWTIRAFQRYRIEVVPDKGVRDGAGTRRSFIMLVVKPNERRIVKEVVARSDSFALTTGPNPFPSEIDLLDPERRESIFIRFWQEQMNSAQQPTLERLEISLGANEMARVIAEQFTRPRGSTGGYEIGIAQALKSAVYH